MDSIRNWPCFYGNKLGRRGSPTAAVGIITLYLNQKYERCHRYRGDEDGMWILSGSLVLFEHIEKCWVILITHLVGYRMLRSDLTLS